MSSTIEIEFQEERQNQPCSVQSSQSQQEGKPNMFFVTIINEHTNNNQHQLSRADIINCLNYLIKDKLQTKMLKDVRNNDVKIEPILTTAVLKACGAFCVDEWSAQKLNGYFESVNFVDQRKGIFMTFDFKFLLYDQFDQCQILDQGKFDREFVQIKPTIESKKGVTIVVSINKKDLQIYAIKKVVLPINISWEKMFNKQIQQIREINALSRLSHPNILRLYGWWIEQGYNEKNLKTYYLYQQTEYNTYLHSSNLEQFAQQHLINYPPQQKNILIRDMVDQILTGIHYIHCQGFFHRDLKIENVLVSKDHKDKLILRICDFDWSKPHINEDGQKIDWTLQSNNAGTPYNTGYKAQKGSVYDASEDLYQTGMILLDLCLIQTSIRTDKKTVHEDAKNKVYPELLKQNYPNEIALIKELLQHKFKNVPELQNSIQYQNFIRNYQ